MLHVCGDVYVEKINYQKENISADLVIWIKPSHCLEIPPTGCNILYFFSIMTGYRLRYRINTASRRGIKQQGISFWFYFSSIFICEPGRVMAGGGGEPPAPEMCVYKVYKRCIWVYIRSM